MTSEVSAWDTDLEELERMRSIKKAWDSLSILKP